MLWKCFKIIYIIFYNMVFSFSSVSTGELEKMDSTALSAVCDSYIGNFLKIIYYHNLDKLDKCKCRVGITLYTLRFYIYTNNVI